MELRVEQLSKSYKNCKAINNISFSIHSGEVVGLLGHNGAGKSTLIKCMMNAIKSYSGCITIDGKNIQRHQELLAKECSFLLEPSFCDYMSAQKNLELLHNLLPDKAARSIEEILSIVSLRKSATKKVGEFSFGMKQRLGLAQIFLTEPHFVVLDEPTVGLDPLGIGIIKNIILELSNAGIAVLFSSHQISDVFDICTRAIVMNEGEIVFDDNIANLLKKTYVIIVNRSIVEKQQFHQLGEDVKVENETIYTDDTSVLSKIMDLVTKNNYEIVDIRTENNYDILRKYLMTGGK